MSKNKPIKTNLNIHYLIPLALISDPYKTEIREVKIISSEGGMLRCQAVEDAERYEIHSFWDEYFQWLIYTGYIIPIDDENVSLPTDLTISKEEIDDYDTLADDEREQVLSDYLSDRFGFLHEGFSYDDESSVIRIAGIKWVIDSEDED